MNNIWQTCNITLARLKLGLNFFLYTFETIQLSKLNPSMATVKDIHTVSSYGNSNAMSFGMGGGFLVINPTVWNWYG